MELDTVLSTGVAAALQMAVKKGFVEKDIDGKNRKRDGSSKTIIEGVGIRDWLDKSVCLSVCTCTKTTLYIYILPFDFREYERDRGRERDRDK